MLAPFFKSNTSKRHILMKKRLFFTIFLSLSILCIIVFIFKSHFVGSTKSQFLPVTWNTSTIKDLNSELTKIRFQNLD